MKLNYLWTSIISVGLICQSALCFSSSLTLHIDSPDIYYKNHNQFELSVEIHNISDKTYIVFPAYIRRKYIPGEGQRARYMPFPGPAIDPWPGAIILVPGQKKTINFSGMTDGDGVWGLDPGRYTLSVSLGVASTSSFTGTGLYQDIDIWRGTVKSNSININYRYKARK